LAARAALLIALVAVAGFVRCVRPAAKAPGQERCLSCHAAHYAAEGSCVSCHRGRPEAGRQELAHQQLLTGRAAEHRRTGGSTLREGERLVEALACRRCHTVAGRGNRLASDLDAVAGQREQAALVASITEPVENMPRFGLDAGQAEAIVALLVRSSDPARAQDAYRVHFARPTGPGGTEFERQCGGCHRALTAAGPLGSGDAGPNLSGLFTPFYPRTAPGERAWTESVLRDWLRNPRSARGSTTMPPVALDDATAARIARDLGSAAPPSR
jgi:mono/diheme cytochrome c family protein